MTRGIPRPARSSFVVTPGREPPCRRPARLVLDRPADARAGGRPARGTPVAHGFAAIYALTSRGDGVRRVDALKAGPLDQTGQRRPRRQVTSWTRSTFRPPERRVAVAACRTSSTRSSALRPFGFRGPAADHVPADLTAQDGDTTTTQVIVPGDGCPSQMFLAAASDAVGGEPLAISSANRSRHVTGGLDAPVHWRVEGLRAELGDADLVILEHADDAAARDRFPLHTTCPRRSSGSTARSCRRAACTWCWSGTGRCTSPASSGCSAAWGSG